MYCRSCSIFWLAMFFLSKVLIIKVGAVRLRSIAFVNNSALERVRSDGVKCLSPHHFILILKWRRYNLLGELDWLALRDYQIFTSSQKFDQFLSSPIKPPKRSSFKISIFFVKAILLKQNFRLLSGFKGLSSVMTSFESPYTDGT
jgi:hypothetical protein